MTWTELRFGLNNYEIRNFKFDFDYHLIMYFSQPASYNRLEANHTACIEK